MGWWGTAIGGALGMTVGGPIGAVVGAVLGRAIDRGAERLDLQVRVDPFERRRLQERFFESAFAVMGHLCKADGRVSESEIAFARSVMDRMELNPAMRRAAMLHFDKGKSPDYPLGDSLGELRRAGIGRGPLLKIFLEIELSAAYADGEPSPGQRAVLETVRRTLQVPSASFGALERLVQIQQRVREAAGAWARAEGPASQGRSQGRPTPTRPDSLREAYATLGLEPKASDVEVKRAYRRLMSRHHPDKLMSRGAPESAIKIASQKTQEIRRAYETISRARAA
jgi:DnaJ like chaperone protein